MLGHMGSQGYMIGSFITLLWWVAFIWLIVFTVLVLVKLDRIVRLLEKK